MRSFILVLLLAADFCPACHSEGTQSRAPASAIAVEPIADPRLAKAIQHAISRDPVLRSEPIHVSVTNGEVSLAGSVPDVAAKWRASKVAATFKGASSLENDIAVSPPAIPDDEIAQAVTEQIHANRATRNANVKATSKDGTVTIRGVADSESQREVMAELASRVAGVRQLDLEIELPALSRPDMAIAAEVRARLDDDARLDVAWIAVGSGSIATRGFC